MYPQYKVITPSTTEPLTISGLLRHAKIDSTDEADLLLSYMRAAKAYIEKQTGQAFMQQGYRRTFNTFVDWREDNRGLVITLERSPLVSVESVKYYPSDGGAQVTMSSSLYHVITATEHGMLAIKEGETWPDLADRPDAVEINFTAGYATADAIPEINKHALRLLTSHFYEQRQPVNIGNIVTEIPFTIKALIDQLRIGGCFS